jgi:hypothetical protein
VHADVNHDGHDVQLMQLDESGAPERVIGGMADPSMD